MLKIFMTLVSSGTVPLGRQLWLAALFVVQLVTEGWSVNHCQVELYTIFLSDDFVTVKGNNLGGHAPPKILLLIK